MNQMNFNEYQKLANRSLNGDEQVLTNCALGLAKETGEMLELIQDYTFKNRPMPSDKVAKELGDVLWYLSQIAEWSGISLESVAESNIEHLKKRYPDCFKED